MGTALPLPHPQLQAKLTEARAKLEGPVDPATGRPLYRPITGRGPSFARRAPEQAVGEYLYSLQTERVRKNATSSTISSMAARL